ncbi:hypothetical protein NECAME_14567 [Necator americanus]|uniref:Uncharacterized protein n=1 Tax=Necator americanus TaxID=51031 RepID=W2SM66_NECAM|nr:hypothetical protein NECAME_14567 [Necator americanus]ETN70730.1 hypothetical protein NECAME_14567 [Necator americanus]
MKGITIAFLTLLIISIQLQLLYHRSQQSQPTSRNDPLPRPQKVNYQPPKRTQQCHLQDSHPVLLPLPPQKSHQRVPALKGFLALRLEQLKHSAPPLFLAPVTSPARLLKQSLLRLPKNSVAPAPSRTFCSHRLMVTHGFPTNFITIDNDLGKTTPSTTAQSVVLEFLTPDDKNDLKINVPSSAGTREPELTSSQSPTPQQEESSSTPTEDEKSPTTSIDVNEATTLSPLPDVKKESTTPKISTKPKDADSSGTTDRNPIMSQITTVPLDKSTLKEISTSFSVSPLIASSSTSRSSTELTSEPGISAQTTDLLSSPSINPTSNTTTEAGESHSERVTTPGQETSPNESTEATAPSTASRSFVTTSRDATNATPPTTLTVTVEIELHNQSTSKADVTLEEKTTTSHNINLPDNPEKTIEKTESSPMTTQPTKIKTDVSTQPNQTKANDVTKDDFGMVTESFVPTRTSSSSATTLSEIELLPKPDELVLIDGQIKVRHPNKQTKLPVLSTTSINEPNVGETSPTTEPVPSSFTVLSTGEHPASSQTSVQTTLKNEMSTEQTITTKSISENSTGSTFNIGTTTQKALREITATELKTETTETAPVPQDLATVDFESLSQSTKLTTHTPTNEPDKGILNAETKAKSTVRPQKEHLSTSEPDEDRISDLSTTERTKTSTSLPEEEKTSSTSTEPLREISGDIVARAPTSAKSNSTTSPKSSNVVPESLTTRPDEIKTTAKPGGEEPPVTIQEEAKTTQEPGEIDSHISTVTASEENHSTTSGDLKPLVTEPGGEETTSNTGVPGTSQSSLMGARREEITPKSSGPSGPENFVTEPEEEQTTSAPSQPESQEPSTRALIPEGEDTTPMSGGPESSATGRNEEQTTQSGDTGDLQSSPTGGQTTPGTAHPGSREPSAEDLGTGREGTTPNTAREEETTPNPDGTEPPGTESGEEQTTPNSGITRGEQLSVTGPGGKQTTLENGQPGAREPSTEVNGPEGKDTTPRSGGTEPSGSGKGSKHNTPTVTGRGSQEVSATKPGVEQTTPNSAESESAKSSPTTMAETTSKSEGKDTTPKSGGPETSVTGPAEEQTTPKSGDTENLQSSPTGGQTTAGTVHLESREPSIEDLGPRREGTTPKNAKKEEITPKSGGAEPSVTGPGIKQTTPKSTLTDESESSPTAIVGTTSKSGHPDSQESSTRTPIPEGEETTPKSGGPETSVTRPSEEQTTLKSGDAGDLQSSPTGEQTTPRTVRPGSREPSAEGLGPGGEETTRSTKGEKKTTPKSGGGKPSVAVPGEEITPHPGPPENRKPSTEEPSPEGKDTIPPSSGTEPLMTVSTEQTTPESGGPGGKEHSVTGSARNRLHQSLISLKVENLLVKDPVHEERAVHQRPGEEPTTPKAGGPGGKQLSVTEPGRKQTTPEPGQPESREHPSEGPGTKRGETTPKRLGEGKTTSKPAGTDHSTTWQGREQVTPEPDQPAGREPSTEGPGSEVEKTTPKSNGVEPFVTGKGSKDNIPMVTGPGGQEVSVTGPGMEQTTLSAETESMEPSSIVEEQTTPKPGHLESREPSTGARVPTVEETTAKFGKEEPTTLNSDGPQPSVTVTKNQQTTLKPKNQKSSTEEPGAGEKQITTKSGGPGGPKLSPTESGGEKTTPETRNPETRKPFTEGLRREEETTPKSGKQARSETVPRGDQTTPNSDQSENRRSSTETLGPRGKQTKPKSAGPEASVTAPGQELTTPRTEEIGAQKTPVTEQRGEQTTPSPDQSNGQNTLTRSGLTKTSTPPNSRLESTMVKDHPLDLRQMKSLKSAQQQRRSFLRLNIFYPLVQLKQDLIQQLLDSPL